MHTNNDHEHRVAAGRRCAWSIAIVAALAAVFAATTLGAARATAPVNTSPPTIEGSLFEGKTLAAGNGSWSNGPTSFAYKWIRCNNPTATRCAAIPGATEKTYTIAKADVGRSLAVFVSGTNSAGTSKPASSKPSAVVSAAAPPAFKTRPVITGKPQVGEALVAKVGTFTGGIPQKFAFQWQTCDQNGANCKDVAGATGESYGVRAADADKALRVQVTATNEYGNDTQTSDRTAVVQKGVQSTTVTTSVAASRGVTTCCQAVRLSGVVSTQKAGENVLVLGREVDALAAEVVASATTDSSGRWTAVVRPHIKTTYRAQAGTSPSSAITVSVRPRVGLGRSGRAFTTRVTARDSFAGSIVLVQRRTTSGWRTVDRVVLNIDSSARFAPRLPHGRSTIRVVLQRREAGPGYATGISRSLTTRR